MMPDRSKNNLPSTSTWTSKMNAQGPNSPLSSSLVPHQKTSKRLSHLPCFFVPEYNLQLADSSTLSSALTDIKREIGFKLLSKELCKDLITFGSFLASCSIQTVFLSLMRARSAFWSTTHFWLWCSSIPVLKMCTCKRSSTLSRCSRRKCLVGSISLAKERFSIAERRQINMTLLSWIRSIRDEW